MKKIILFITLCFGLFINQTIAQTCPVLTEPDAIVTGANSPTLGTCSGAAANNDAKIDFTGIQNSDKVEKWEGTTYGGGDYNSASGVVTAGAVSFTGLKHSTDYTFRFWNVNNACYTDVTVSIPAKNCCPTIICLPIKVTKHTN
jgi:trimeric autotransporter adhesin